MRFSEKLSSYDKNSKISILEHAQGMQDRCLRDVLPENKIFSIAESIVEYGTNRKGHFGNLVEKYIFNIEPNSNSEPDFPEAEIELKTTPLKEHKTRKYVAKERLVFSMIDYKNIVSETWEASSFLHKNKLLLLMFYLYKKELDIIDYKFKIIRILSIIGDISNDDIQQIKRDWQFIVDKIKRGKAHELSEGDTSYLGACTKSATSKNLREQAVAYAPLAKPRAFSLKQSYLNYIIQQSLKIALPKESLYKDHNEKRTIEEYIEDAFAPYLGKKASDMQSMFGIYLEKRPKNYYRLLINRLLNIKSKRIVELEKADITLRVIALEHSGNLRESISFPYFDYCEIVEQLWEQSDLYNQLDSKRFLFIVFRKTNDDDAILENAKFWNYPASDMDKAGEVWNNTIEKIKNNNFDNFIKISDNMNIHVRPHGRNSKDRIKTLDGHTEVKRCFWINAKYIQKQLER